MEDILGVLGSLPDLRRELEVLRKAHFDELDALFYGIAHPEAEAKAADSAPAAKSQENTSVTPQQTKKRAKRLSSLAEDHDEPDTVPDTTVNTTTTRTSARVSNSQLLAIAEDEHNSTASLMPPPPVPAAADTTISSGRPQRAAKLKTEKLLKEPSLNRKMRRPSHEETIKVKVESEQRPSQFNSSTSGRPAQESEKEQPEPEPAIPAAAVQEEDPEDANTTKTLRVKIKREKISGEGLAPSTDASTATNVTTVSSVTTEAVRPDDTVASNTTTNTTANTTEVTKKGRKKKKDAESHRPIKVERFSDLDKNSPVSSRTRKCSTESRPNQERSIYKDALEGPSVAEQSTAAVAPTAANETGTISNATMVLGPAPTDGSPMGPAGDATFEVHSGDKKAPLMKQDSLLTEDESLDEKLPATTKLLSSIKAIKLPTRTHELFNPLLQSPVKLRVEAFENAAIAQTNMRPKRAKDVGTPGTSNTPKIGKLPAPTVGRFFTPTQTSSTLPLSSAQPKKAPASASKAATLMKTATGTNLKSVNSTSTKTLSRENSGDDFRKGLHNLAEERKKLREQKHQQAALQREAKERERAERMAKLAAERAKKQEERKRIEERKRQELEELQRKMRQQEEAEMLKKAKAKELEQQKLQQLTGAKPKKMLPPPPKTKYTWEMLHEDDSTDDEGKVTHKRPPAPTWSRSHVRGEAIAMQSHCPTDIIDSFFSVAPTTPDLKQIFPNIDPSQLKRNSSVLWSTPPRYSELPKY
ncbi:histone-lysine N-methyltransferase, H3 lysine-79 specific isoform X2 [Drosophila biarmipes]|uniref:histone-lysine N-methyltransferase, H3 lysine-79 specific isoform X2 n=1 Tax=Drosophila biarmipes TaxID=125945 RepID=UPI0007E7A11A|nr:histone-lysine N-methyltransferase, H3 lysine-79 specific isoform X2 [Drosophila biarmipes]